MHCMYIIYSNDILFIETDEFISDMYNFEIAPNSKICKFYINKSWYCLEIKVTLIKFYINKSKWLYEKCFSFSKHDS